ncbi:MAG: hypothetical protein GY844_26095 [Bradyrhizobium sp.]|jgi:hypothetical protein|nr:MULTISPECIES: hypothetical protein [unclassified Sphingomonas]MCP4619895.1 hypothetical protein [Bradyrhizobium sp.]
MMRAGLLLALFLAACSGGTKQTDKAQPPQDLERAAIERGLVRNPADTDIAGLYARDTDRICIVPDEQLGYRIGAFVDYGDRITCSGSGRASRVGEALHIELGEDGSCSFDARYDGDKITFPGALPDGCNRYCAKRASYAGLEVTRLSESAAEAAAMRDTNGKRLCGNG